MIIVGRYDFTTISLLITESYANSSIVRFGSCYGAYDRHGIGSEELQFLDIYESWIGFVH
jgi:hypothetical protein